MGVVLETEAVEQMGAESSDEPLFLNTSPSSENLPLMMMTMKSDDDEEDEEEESRDMRHLSSSLLPEPS